MKSIKISRDVLKAINPKKILYAEYAESGAMGACGTARVFTLEGEKLKFYLIDDIFNNNDNEAIYVETIKLLKRLNESGFLFYGYAGCGNHAYKARDVEFSRDDDRNCFVYQPKIKKYIIPASCKGVYGYIVASFAKREATLEEMQKYFDQNWQKMNGGECWFYRNYLEQSNRNDNGQGWFDFTVMDYLNAIGCLKHLLTDDYTLNSDDLSDYFNALFKYRLRDVTERIGWNKLNKIFAQMIREDKVDLFSRIEIALGEPVEAIYDKLQVVKYEPSSSVINVGSLDELLRWPMLVEFSKETHAKIIKDIMERSANSFCPDAKGVALYLANYLLEEDRLPFSDVLPAVAHIVEVLPTNDFNHTHIDQLFWLCGEILDRAWRYLEEDETKQKKYRGLMYELYWPRVGSLWPVLNRSEFEFKDETASKIFDDSLSFVMSLSDIDERNAEIKAFLEMHASQVGYNAGALGRRAFVYTLKGLKPKEEFERILEVIEPQDYHSYLSYPDGLKEAEILMNELFRTDAEARITGLTRLQVLESLVITPNTIGVGEYILNYIDEHFDDYVRIMTEPAMEVSINYQPAVVLEDLFVAMSKGVTEENEFPALKSIEKKMLGLKGELKCDAEKLAKAKRYARKHRRTILFQRSALQKIF